MAPAPDTLAPAGSSSYSSDTMKVGDGTWDYTKNTFLLPNLVGLNFETMRYNGMANRFSTLTEYHSLILGHGVLAAITFLFIIPLAVMIAKFFVSRWGGAIKCHAYLNVLTVLFTTALFILGFFAVGPPRNLTNPHHGIGVAIYVLVLLQAMGGRLVRHIVGHSFRVHLHRWSGRIIALLGLAQVPLGMTLYGSPKHLFVLYALWMTFLALLFFMLDYRQDGRRQHVMRDEHDRSEAVRRDRGSSEGGTMRWLAPLAAAVGALALLRGRKENKETENRNRSRSRTRTPSVDQSRVSTRLSRVRSPSRHDAVSSRRWSDSYVDDKSAERRHDRKGGGIMSKVLGVGAGLGAGALIARFTNPRNERQHDGEYSAVATDTPSRPRRSSRHRPTRSEYSDEFDEESRLDRWKRSPLLPPARSEAGPRSETVIRPRTPTRPTHSHAGRSRLDNSALDYSDYSSYMSPSRRTPEPKSGRVAKALFGRLGVGWLATKMADRKKKREEEQRRFEDEEERAEDRRPRSTGEAYGTPTRTASRRRASRREQSSEPATTPSAVTGEASSLEPPRPRGAASDAAPPVGAAASSTAAESARRKARSQLRARRESVVNMPDMPDDPRGILHTLRPDSENRRDDEGDKAVSVEVKMHDDRGRNVTLRRLTEEEARAARRERRRRRSHNDSVSSLSGVDLPSAGTRRYRRDPSQQAERVVENPSHGLPPSSPPNSSYAAGAKRPIKHSAYYSGGGGQPGPSGSVPTTAQIMSSLGTHGTWSGTSPVSPAPAGPAGAPLFPPSFSAASAAPSGPPPPQDVSSSVADRRRRRRLERRESRPASAGVEYS